MNVCIALSIIGKVFIISIYWWNDLTIRGNYIALHYMWVDLWKGTTSVKTSQKYTVVVYTNIFFQWMFAKLYLSLKTMDNLKCKILQTFYFKIVYIHTNVLMVW